MTDCATRHTKLPTGAVTRSKAVQALLKTHSCQQCSECGSGRCTCRRVHRRQVQKYKVLTIDHKSACTTEGVSYAFRYGF